MKANTIPCLRCKGTGKVRASSGRSGIPSRDFRCRDCWGYGVVVDREQSA